MGTLRETLFDSLGRLTTRRPGWVVAGAALVSVVAGVLVSDLSVDATFMGLLPTDDPRVEQFRDATRAFGGSSNLLLLVDGEQTARDAFLRELEQGLLALEDVKGFDAEVESLALLGEPAAVSAPPEALVTVARLATTQPEVVSRWTQDPGVASGLEVIGAAAVQGAPTGELRSLPLAPGLLLESLAAAARGEPVHLAGLIAGEELRLDAAGRPVSSDGDANLAIVRLHKDGLDMAIGAPMFARIRDATAEVAVTYPDLEWGYGGAIPFGYEDENNVLDRTGWISLASLVAVLLLFLLVERSPAIALLISVPLGLGVLWTFAGVRLLLGHVTLTSAVFGILLFGLAIDFAIHLVVRIHDEEQAGAPDRGEAIRRALRRTGPGILTGGLTTALAFFALLAGRQPAGRHLGATTGMGLLCSLAAMLVLLPALLTIASRLRIRTAGLRLPALGPWVGLCARRPWWVLGIAVALTLAAAVFVIPRAHVEYDIEKMATRGTRAGQVSDEIQERFQLSSDYGLCVCDDLEQAARAAETLRDSPRVARVETASDLLPRRPDELAAAIGTLSLALGKLGVEPAADSLLRAELPPAELNRIAKAARGLQALVVLGAAQVAPEHQREAARIAAAAGELATAVEDDPARAAAGLAPLDRALRQVLSGPLRAILAGEARPRRPEDLPAALREKFFDAAGRTVVYVLPRDSVLDVEKIRAFMADLELAAPGRGTGLPAMTEILVTEGLEDLPRCLAVAILLVGALLMLDLRRPLLVAITFLPLVVAATLAISLVILTGQSLSVVALGGLPLIFGIGVDDGVHLVHRVRDQGDPDPTAAVSAVGRAILLTSLTTGLSFGGLLLMNHASIEALGFLVASGVALCFVTSVSLFPAVWSLVHHRLR